MAKKATAKKTKAKKAPIKKITQSKEPVKLISVVVNSVNKSWAKTLILNKKEHDQIMKASKKHYGKDVERFALFCDTNLHKLLDSGYGGLTKVDFDKLLREKYNGTRGYDKKGNSLKDVE